MMILMMLLNCLFLQRALQILKYSALIEYEIKRPKVLTPGKLETCWHYVFKNDQNERNILNKSKNRDLVCVHG